MRNGELPTSRILELLDEWAKMGVFSVVLTGGEPALHKDFLAIVKHAHDLGFVIGIATNGMPLTQPLLEQMPRDDLIISVSVDELHGQGTKDGLSDFQYSAQKIKLIQGAGINAAIMMTTSSTNVASLRPVLDWAIENRVSLRSVPYVPMGRASLNKHLAHRKEDADAVAQFWIAEEGWDRVRDPELGLCAGKVFVFLLAMVFALRRCMSGRGICYVTSNGDLFPCTTCSGNKVLCAGNVAWTPFNEIWRADWDIRDITWNTFEAACKGCAIADRDYFCTGRCPGSSSVLHGQFDQCGATEFQKASVLAREALFKQHVSAEPTVPIRWRRDDALHRAANDRSEATKKET